MMKNTPQVVDEPPHVRSKSARRPGRLRLRRLRTPDVSSTTLDHFRQACGQQTAYLVRISSSESGSDPLPVLWDRPSLIVGKGKDCDLQLPHAEVSRQHAYFQLLGNRIYCADLGSRTGTHWSNGAAQAGWIESEESISIGPYSLSFERTSRPLQLDGLSPDIDEDQEPPAEEPGDVSVDGEVYLDFVNTGRNVRRYRVTRDVTLIGSGDSMKIHLTHPSVSHAHCSVIRTPTGLWVADLLSSDGTIVNGQVESLAPLRPGDEFQVGRFLVAVHYGKPDDLEEPPIRIQSEIGEPLPQQAEEIHRRPMNRESLQVMDPEPGQLSTLNQLAHLASAPQSANGRLAPVEGLSEQFVLNIIKELGVLQQQALNHAQQSMKETVSQLASTYQQRIDALENQHSSLRDQLSLLSLSSARTDDPDGPKGLPVPLNNNHMLANRFEDELSSKDDGREQASEAFAPVEQEEFDELDPALKEQWIREQLKAVESQLDQTHRGWGRKLVDMLGY